MFIYSWTCEKLLSVMIDNTWKPISFKPIFMHLTMSNKFSLLKYSESPMSVLVYTSGWSNEGQHFFLGI